MPDDAQDQQVIMVPPEEKKPAPEEVSAPQVQMGPPDRSMIAPIQASLKTEQERPQIPILAPQPATRQHFAEPHPQDARTAIMVNTAHIHNPIMRTLARMGGMAGNALLESTPGIAEQEARAQQADSKLMQAQHQNEIVDLKAQHTAELEKLRETARTALEGQKQTGASNLQGEKAEDAQALAQTHAGKNEGKITFDRGIPTSIVQDGKILDPKDPNLNPHSKALLEAGQGAYEKSTSDALQQRLKGYETLTAPKWAQLGLQQAKNAAQIYDVAGEADWRYERMTQDAKSSLEGNQQAMVSLLTNHIGMTLGLQRGARITKDMLNEARQSTPWLQGVEAKFSDDGYLSGVTLAPQQIGQMLDLSRSQRDLVWDQVRAKAKQESGLTKVPARETTSTPTGGRTATSAPGGGAPTPGTVRTYQGASYKFKGGDWHDQKNWVKQ